MYEIVFTYGEQDIEYTGVFDIERGSWGDYFNAPEPDEIIDMEVYDEDGNEIKDGDIIQAAEEAAYDNIHDYE